MNDPRNKEFFQRLKTTFDNNFAITRLYATYLENYPEIITADIIDELCSDGLIEKKDALCAVLCQIFGLDTENDPNDRHLMKRYLYPSVRILDKKRYENNPYYLNIHIPNITRGRWEFKTECYPPYRGVIANDMNILPDMTEIPPLGFFEEPFYFPAVLEDGNEWMTLTPVDLDTCEEAIAAAKGKVVTFGLGLGYYTYMASEKPEVESITVVERSQDVIDLFREYILPQFPNKDKVKIVCDDAFEYAERVMPREHFDVAFADTYRDASDGAPMYRRMKLLQRLSPDTKFLYWIENFLISRVRAENYASLLDELNSGAPIPCPLELTKLLDKI